MHELRTLLPEKLVNPTRAILQPSSRSAPEKLALQLKEAAVNGSKDIQKFKTGYHSDAMRELFQNVNAAEIPQGQDVWNTDYVTLVEKMGGGASDAQTAIQDVDEHNISDTEAIKQFREASPDLDFKVPNEGPGLPLELTVSSTTFVINTSNDQSKSRYTVTLEGDSNQSQLGKDIVHYVQTHHGNDRLPALLVRSHDSPHTAC